MSITLTSNYQDVLKSETVEHIKNLLDEDYFIEDILKFIDEYSEEDFVTHYEEYVRVGEEIGYEAVDALIAETEIDNIHDCEERYRGCFDSTADFAEDYYSNLHDIPCDIVVDWEATWDASLHHSFTDCAASYRRVHIFSDY